MPTGFVKKMAEVLNSQKPIFFSYVVVLVLLICIGPIKSQAQSGTLATDEGKASYFGILASSSDHITCEMHNLFEVAVFHQF